MNENDAVIEEKTIKIYMEALPPIVEEVMKDKIKDLPLDTKGYMEAKKSVVDKLRAKKQNTLEMAKEIEREARDKAHKLYREADKIDGDIFRVIQIFSKTWRIKDREKKRSDINESKGIS